VVLGVLSLPCCCCGFLGAPLAMTALATGLVGMDRIRRDPRSWRGGVLAVIGIATASLGLILQLLAAFMAFDDSLRARYIGSFF
jgi:hypothetical protein